MVDTGNRLAETISSRVDEVNTTLKTTGNSLVLDLSLRGGDVVSKLEQTGTRITDTIVQRSNRVTDQFRESAEALADVIGNRGDAVREMLAARLQSFEDMFNHGGAELAERIARNSTTLGNLITRHLAEFDRTVKTYGGEMVERLGERTQDISGAMRDYLDNFDTRVTTKSAEVTASLDQQFVRFRTRSTAAPRRSTRRSPPASWTSPRRMAEGGKEVVGALDKRIADVTSVINVRGAKLAESIGAKIDDIDKALGVARAWRSPTTSIPASAASRSCCVGRAETVTKEIEARSQTAAELLDRAHGAAEPCHQDQYRRGRASIEQLTSAIGRDDQHPHRADDQHDQDQHRREPSARSPIWRPRSATVISSRLEQLGQAIKTNTGEAERSLTQLTTNTTTAIRSSAHDAERTLSGMSTGVSNVLKQNASEVERTLLAVSAEVARNFVGKADEISTAVSQRAAEMTQHPRREVERTAGRAHRQEPGVRQRGEPRHRPCGEGDRGQGLHTSPRP